MVLSDGNLREVNFIIRAHGESWKDDKYKYHNIATVESRLMFVMQGELIYEIFGKKYSVTKNHMLLIPERQNVSFWVPKDGYARIQYCNFNAVLEDESVLDYLYGEWAAEMEDSEEILRRFKRFHYTDKDNLLLDCLEKRGNLLYLLTEFVCRAGLKTRNKFVRRIYQILVRTEEV